MLLAREVYLQNSLDMIINQYGPNALIVKLDGGISKTNLLTIQSIINHFKALDPSVIREVVPAYDSLVVCYENDRFSYEQLREIISNIDIDQESYKPNRRITIPICFDTKFALDAEKVEDHAQLSFDQILESFLQETYDVYMMGFLPGFTYMASLPERLRCPRLPSPRVRIPDGSLAIAGEQVAIYPSASPGGWNIIGHCPLRVFDVEREDWGLFKVQDQVRFESITVEEHNEILWKVQDGSFDYSKIIQDGI